MLVPSFRLLRPAGAFLFVVLIVAGCGGARGDGGSKLLSGQGFTTSVPAGWKVKREPGALSAARGEELVSVAVFPLARPYRPALERGASREIDRRVAELAAGLRGSVSQARAASGLCPYCPQRKGVPAGVLARTYVIRYRNLVQEITFVLLGRREYELTCRRQQDADGKACRELRSSFRLA